MTKRYIVWKNDEREIGIVTTDAQLAYELRKGTMNTLGLISYEFMDSWGDITADYDCIIEEMTDD